MIPVNQNIASLSPSLPVLPLPVLPLLGLVFLALAGVARAEVAIEAAQAPDGLLDNLRARLGLAGEDCKAPGWRVQRLYKRADQDFLPALRAFGYYTAKVAKRLETQGDCWQATFDIELGKRTHIRERRVTINGEAADDPNLQKLLGGLPLAQGAPLNHAEYEAIKDRLRQFAAERGYLDFAFTRRELRVDPQQATADIHLEADSGPRYRFGELRFSEQPLDEDFVRRLAQLRTGEPYDVMAVTALDRQLSDAGYFQRVEVRPQRDQAENREVPIDIRLEPAAQHAWRAGIGYATDTGPRASLRYDNRYVNPRGHRFESALSLSPVLSSLSADYVVPGENPQRDSYSFGAQLRHEDNDSSISDSGLLVARHTKKTGRWTQNRFIELLHESSTVGDEKTTATLLMPGIGVSRTKADNLLRTRRGYRVDFEARVAQKGLLSTASVFRLTAGAKGIYRFGDAGRVTGRIDAGLSAGDSKDELPASLRFFAGGDNSVRGYAYKSLGPVDDDGEPEGGRHLLATSIEYEHPVFGEDWWAAAFVDAGNAFDSDRIDVRAGYGVGLRWYSPIGRLRLDVAIPDDKEDDEWRLHFGLGADL